VVGRTFFDKKCYSQFDGFQVECKMVGGKSKVMTNTIQADQGESLPLTLKEFLERFVTKPDGEKILELHFYGNSRTAREIEEQIPRDIKVVRHTSLD
jgi:hypothetical protein